jgi:hypothetical protein
MAHCYYHALSSVRKWGGTPDDYLPLHQWFDQSKAILADPRHRALRHHAEGIFMLEVLFGATIVNADGRIVPVRLIGEQHVREDLGSIPSFADWARLIAPRAWMLRVTIWTIPWQSWRTSLTSAVSRPSPGLTLLREGRSGSKSDRRFAGAVRDSEAGPKPQT